MAHAQLPIESLPIWQAFNNIAVTNARIAAIPGKGLGLVADGSLGNAGDVESAGTDAANSHGSPVPPLIAVPHDLVLHALAVEEYAKQDNNFRLLLDAVGHQTPRGDVLLFLLVQIVLGLSRPGEDLAAPPTAWTHYVKFLPADVPLPTMWTTAERLLLQGTSLEAAVDAKRFALELEFDQLRERSSDIPFWQAAFWERESGPQLRHWFLVDAWYRSRCLELPRSGPSMVPYIDMVNHSATPNAYYEEGVAAAAASSGRASVSDDEVVLLLRPQQHPSASDEITISYSGSSGEHGTGAADGGNDDDDDDDDNGSSNMKPASEMLFSYGFIDPQSSRHSLVLPFRPFPDDPLAKAKLHVFGGPAPRLEIERLGRRARAADGGDSDDGDLIEMDTDNGTEDDGTTTKARTSTRVRWICPFAYLMCVNEEDGLDFRLLQENDGSTQLRMFWQDADVTDSARDFASLARTHERAPIFQLRVVTVLQEAIESQLERMQAAGGQREGEEQEHDDTDMADGRPDHSIRSAVAKQAALLRDIESRVLSSALEALEAERSDLLADATVVAYLGSMEVAENELADEEASNQDEADEPMQQDEDDDFS